MGATKEDRGIEERRKCNRVGENVGKYKGGSKEQEQQKKMRTSGKS